MLRVFITLLIFLSCSSATKTDAFAAEHLSADVVVYGGTSAAVTTAVQVKRMGKSVVIVCPDKHLGGLTTGGLGWTDSGNKNAIGGISREFYQRVWQHYQAPTAWSWQDQAEFGNRNQGAPDSVGGRGTMWVFEPHVAEQIFEDFVRESNITVIRDEWLDRTKPGVTTADGRITSIRMLSGNTYSGKMFVDATYEGDLLATAGISYHVGREANSVYDEQWNGIQVGVLHHTHWFQKATDPYVKSGNPASGVLAEIGTEPPGKKGDGDARIQAYCFRMCLTNVAENRLPFPKPDGYDPAQYELLLRVFDNGWREMFGKFDPMPNHKTDTNNHGPFSTDFIGKNYDYPDGSYLRRQEIIHDHEVYQKGYMYFMANDPRVPADIRAAVSKWGLPKDEFKDNGGWSHQIYVREARRMIGHYVMTEHDCLDKTDTPNSIGMGSYTLDSHNVQRYITPEGTVQNEGDIGVKTPRPYEIAYGTILPKKNECVNLLAPVCVSSSHIAFGSIRMEPVFMILGQSAATAACLALEQNMALQDLPYGRLQERLLADGQVLELDVADQYTLSSKKLPGVVIDDRQAELSGQWQSSSANTPYVDAGYQHNDNDSTGQSTATFTAKLRPGRYDVRLTYSPNNNRASNVPVVVEHAGGQTMATVDQKLKPPIEGTYVSVGTFNFSSIGRVTIGTQGTNGYVLVDAVQFLPVK